MTVYFRSLTRSCLVASLLGCLAAAASHASEPAARDLIGRHVDNFTLQDFRGKAYSLADYSDRDVVVLFFLGTECPLAKLYGPRMQQLSERYSAQNVAVLGISSNVQDSITELAAFARIHGITFPVLKDPGNRIAELVGATRTPQAFVLDRQRKIRYAGRVDAQFTFGSGVGLAQPVEQRADLQLAIDQLLAGQEIEVSFTEAKGCLIGRVQKPQLDSPVTYSKQIARIMQDRCLECHRPGQIAPFALTDYEQVSGWGEMIAEVVRERRMPPWHASPEYGHFANENRLTDEELELIRTWVRHGCPEGDPSDLPAPRKFHENYFLSQPPDQVVYMTEQPVEVKAEGVENYRYYTVDPGFEEDKWVKVAECMPGNRAVVHHIIVYAQPPRKEEKVEDDSKEGQPGRNDRSPDVRNLVFLAGFAPGTRPLQSPPGWAKRIPARSKLVFEMHYTPIGSVQQDRSSIGFVYIDKKDVTYEMATGNALNARFEIPPRTANYEVTSQHRFNREVTLLSLFPHMHVRGQSFRYELIYPGKDGRREILLDVPRYDFNWQNSFVFAEPKVIPAGSTLFCTAHFDNSEENLSNPDPTKAVRWGPQTWEEMMIGWYDIGVPREPRDSAGEQP